MELGLAFQRMSHHRLRTYLIWLPNYLPAGKNLGDVSIKIFFCHLIGNLAQLTLFPSGGVFP